METDPRPDQEHFGEASLGVEDADLFLGWDDEESE